MMHYCCTVRQQGGVVSLRYSRENIMMAATDSRKEWCMLTCQTQQKREVEAQSL
jgi:hypothetical protein